MECIEVIAINHILQEIFDSSSSDYEEVLAVVNIPKKKKLVRIQNYVENVVHLYSDAQFQSHFRMQRRTFEFILNIIGPEICKNVLSSGRPNISAEKQLLITLWILGTPDSYRSVCDRFGVGKATGVIAVRRVVKVLYARVNLFISWPRHTTMLESAKAFQAVAGFPNVIGAIDGTHISITAPTEHPEAYVNRKGVHSIQLQVVSDEKGKFIHCHTGHPGSVHDQRVFTSSQVAGFLNDPLKFPNDYHLLGDAAYVLHKHLMVPYKDNGHLTAHQINYNKRHSSTRMAVERAFALLKGRMRRLLDNLPMTRSDLIPKYIITCCIIHNICLLRKDEFQPIAIGVHNVPEDDVPCNVHGEVGVRNGEVARMKHDLIAAELALQEDL